MQKQNFIIRNLFFLLKLFIFILIFAGCGEPVEVIEEVKEERDELLARLQEGTVTKGIVKNITDFGAFIDLGGIDGLLHITDMSWKRVKHPSDLVKIGDEISVKVSNLTYLRYTRNNYFGLNLI